PVFMGSGLAATRRPGMTVSDPAFRCGRFAPIFAGIATAIAWPEPLMTNLAVTNDLFFDRTGMDPHRVETIVGEALAGMDDGELFLEYSQSESVALDDGRIKSASFDTTQGFGLRAVAGEAAGYAHASEVAEGAMRRAATPVRAVASGHAGTL